MKTPTDLKQLKRFLGMVSYLQKFLPNVSKETEVLRNLDKANVEFEWKEHHAQAFDKVKQLITQAPVLSYYDQDKELTLQCDASQGGLGAAIMQNGAPVAYASRALTPTEKNYA